MIITGFQSLLDAARQQPEPQRLLLVFTRAELPEKATAEQRAKFEQGEGGARVGAGLFDGTVCIGSRNNLIAALLEDGYPRVFQRRVVFNNQYHSMG